MKIFPRVFLFWVFLASFARADQATVGALKELIGGAADLDAAYLAAHEKKSPLKDFEAALFAGKARLLAAAGKSGVAPDLARELTAWAAVYEKTGQFLQKDPIAEEQRLWRAADDLAALTQLAPTLGRLIGAATRLTAEERRTLGADVEARFGKKVREFPRGDVSPFASGSRSPFASAMWMVNLAFDDTVKR
jgi:hypothetical protein